VDPYGLDLIPYSTADEGLIAYTEMMTGSELRRQGAKLVVKHSVRNLSLREKAVRAAVAAAVAIASLFDSDGDGVVDDPVPEDPAPEDPTPEDPTPKEPDPELEKLKEKLLDDLRDLAKLYKELGWDPEELKKLKKGAQELE